MNAIAIAASATLRAPLDPQALALNRAIRACWKAHIQEHHASAAQHAAYALLRGQSLDKTFTPLRRPSKIRGQGGIADRARREAERSARGLSTHAFLPFAELLRDVPAKLGRYQDRSGPLLSRVSA